MELNNTNGVFPDSLAELSAEWEDVPTEEVWYLGERIGNYSMPKKEARKATEKILAWKRLKDKGFRFAGYGQYDDSGDESPAIAFEYPDLDEMFYNKQLVADLDLLFGGEE